jgi:hypothetical protein
VAKRSKAWICGRSPAGIEGSNPAGGIDVSCCVLSVRGLCDELNTRLEESYRLWSVIVRDLGTSRKREGKKGICTSAISCLKTIQGRVTKGIQNKKKVWKRRLSNLLVPCHTLSPIYLSLLKEWYLPRSYLQQWNGQLAVSFSTCSSEVYTSNLKSSARVSSSF